MIYLLEDDESIRELVIYTLKSQGYEAKGFERPSLFWKELEKELPSLLLLDVMLPEEDGITILKKLRVRPDTRRLPVIMLTARSEERDELQGFSLGVDEYISKPFSPKILVARIEAILRRGNAGTGEILEAAGIRVDKDAHEASVDGQPVDLSNKEFELLIYFMENQGMALSREKILNNVWNYDYFGDARTIDTHVKKLRSKLGEKGEFIKTIWGMGYKFEVNA